MGLVLAILVATSAGRLPDDTVEISFRVSPSLVALGGTPKLIVEIKNISSAAIPLMRFASDACFAHFYLSAKLTSAVGETEAAPPCPVKDWPGVAATLASGKTERRELNLAALFPSIKWGKGHYELEASWETESLAERVGEKYAARAAQSSMSGGEFTIAPLLASFRIAKGQTVALPGGARLRFDGHGHKDVAAGGPSSPLIISGSFAARGKKELEEFSTNVHADEGTAFVVEGHGFDLGKWEYGSWMELRYFGPVE